MLFIAPLLAAQDKDTAKPAQERATAKATPAAAPVQSKFSLPVTGLTADNAKKVQTALEAVSHTAWTCPDCKMSQETKGQCTQCKVDLVSQAHKCLGNVKADAAGGTISAVLNPGAQVKLSEVERALGSASVKLDGAKLTMVGSTQLLVQGPGTAEAAKKFEEGMKSAKLFESMEIEHKADSRDYVITTRAGANAPTHATLTSAIARAGGEGFKLVDIVWVGPKSVS
jgi:hypothetical protein